MQLNSSSKRLAIYSFYDKQGIVDDYIVYFLKELRRHVSYLYIVSNGNLNENEKVKFEQYGDEVVERKNKEFDALAYKESLEDIGQAALAQYDEIIMLNSTIMGPVCPLEEMFKKMNILDVDFWGITVHNEVSFDPFGTVTYKYIPQYLQTYFIAVRKNMFTSQEFIKYWSEMPEIHNFAEAMGNHEVIFTKTFADKGYKWTAYINTDDIENHSYHPIIMNPVELMKNRHCPIFCNNIFTHNYGEFLNFSVGNQAYELMEYLKKETNYDVDLIWQNIIRTQNMADIRRNLHLDYILSTDVIERKNVNSLRNKVALILHIYFEDLIDYCYRYATSMPEYSDIYITTNTEEKKEKIQAIFSKLHCNKCEVIVIKNRGRDISALLTASKNFIMQYDLVCFAHDKKVGQLDKAIKGESFSYHCFENVLYNDIFVDNIIQTFDRNIRLGLLVPPPPYHADYYPTISFEWGYNFENTKKLADEIGLTVDINAEKEPIAPLGTMFWFRPKAMKLLFDQDWQYEDFPPEPNDTDGTLLHAIERIYPFVAQEAGYYCAWLMNDKYARIEVDNLYYMLRKLNDISFKLFGFNSHYGLTSTMKYHYNLNQEGCQDYNDILLKKALKEKIKKLTPTPIWNIMKKFYYMVRK